MNITTLRTRRETVLAFFLAAALFAAGTAFAQNEAADAAQIQVAENVQHRLINLTDNVIKRADAAVVRLENIEARIDSRMTKLKAMGADTSVAEGRLAEARAALAAVKTSIEALPSAAQAVSGDSPRAALAIIRTELWKIQRELRIVRQGYLDTIMLMKEAVAQSAAAPQDAETEDQISE